MKTLNNQELNSIIGGYILQISDEKDKNLNSIKDCICFFDNSPSKITNVNEADKCKCACEIINFPQKDTTISFVLSPIF